MSVEYLFPSKEWVLEFCKKLNESEEYRRSAKKWEGDIVFMITNLPERLRELFGDVVAFKLNLWHGECRGWEWVENPEEAKADYVISGKYPDWLRIIRGELQPIPALITGKLKVKGNLAVIMRFATAAIAMVKAAQNVPSKFE